VLQETGFGNCVPAAPLYAMLSVSFELFNNKKPMTFTLQQSDCAAWERYALQGRPATQHDFAEEIRRFGVADDCPIIDGLLEFCQVRSHALYDTQISVI
jgi:hypothetical protein